MPNDIYPVQWVGQQALMALPEHIDVSNAGPIRDELLTVIDGGAEALIADMTATVSCDHAGADAVARAYQRAAASRTQLRLVVTSEAVLQMLGMTGVGRLVPVYPSVQAALAVRWPAANPRPDRSGTAAERAQRDERDDETLRDEPVTDVGVEVALLNRDGVITWVNQAWQTFAAANGGDRVRTGPGVSYLQACAAAGDDSVAAQVAGAIRAALAGDLPGPLAVQVPCHSPATERWFDVLISSRLDDYGRCAGAAVTLSLARSQPRNRLVHPVPDDSQLGSGASSAVTAGVLWKMLDAVGDGVALADDAGTLVLANRRLEEMFGYRPAELIGQPVERLIPAHLQASHRGHHAAYARAPRIRPMGSGAPLTGLRKDGSTFPAEVSLSPLATAHGRFALAVVRDLSTADQQVHRSQELLDTVVTALYHIGVDLQAAVDLPGDAARPRIEAALNALDDTIDGIRDATTDRDP